MHEMTINSTLEKLEELKEEEEEEEVLSLCDLPVYPIDADQSTKPDSLFIETQEEFDFCSWSGQFSKESEMCAADEIFFQGQILPFRPTLTTTSFEKFKRCESRSDESSDLGSLSEFQSNSSRSNSLRSQNSSSSSSTTTTTTITRISKPEVQIQNQFHKHSSPQPQLTSTVSRQASFGNQCRKSSTWDFLRLGVVPAPNLKVRDTNTNTTTKVLSHCVKPAHGTNSANKTNASGNSSNKVNKKRSYHTIHSGKRSSNIFKQLVGKGGDLWSGCKCSVETVRSDIIMIRSGTKSSKMTESKTHAVKEKVLELKRQKHREKHAKKNMSRRRTFEWLKELSLESYPDEEALLISNS